MSNGYVLKNAIEYGEFYLSICYQSVMDVTAIQTMLETIDLHQTKLNAKQRRAVLETIDQLDQGHVGVVELKHGKWQINTWVKKAILLFFQLAALKKLEAGDLQYFDKIPLKTNFQKQKVRVVPPAVVRYGAFLEPGVVMMPSFVNIGAWVGAGTMVDTWATVGSCAYIGRNVHLSGGVGIGGVLEPLQSVPVIVEDGAFIGSRAIVVEGVRIGQEAVIGAGVVLTASTPIIDVSGPAEIIYKGEVPKRSVVIPGMRPKIFPAGTYHVPCALIIGQRTASTDLKTSLNDTLRHFAVQV